MFDSSRFNNLIGHYTTATITRNERIAQSGSNRIYTRLFLSDGTTLMGVYNDDVKENEAFFTFTDFFYREGINVPQLLTVSDDRQYYLLSDLGDETLFSYLSRRKEECGGELPEDVVNYFKAALRELVHIQLCGRKNFDFSVCYPREAFDRQSMQWDLNYFKYFFLKVAYIPFDEQKLEDDFQTLMDYLTQTESDFFLFRDFQSRNIMIKDKDVYFIDYQGGRKGALQYDVASLLFQARAGLSDELREQLLEYYLQELQQQLDVDADDFRSRYYGFVLIRALQVLGAYGYRGYFERKTHFLKSIPPAVENLRYLLDNQKISIELPELTAVMRSIIARPWQPQKSDDGTLTVVVKSFSYKKGIPQDESDNGGGFVFDCRALPNPGREAQYRSFTGRDQCVIDYLERYPEVETFKQHLFAIVDMSVDNYLERHFTHLCVNCGCTGGQHRSVYFAQSIADHLRAKYPQINVVLQHREQE